MWEFCRSQIQMGCESVCSVTGAPELLNDGGMFEQHKPSIRWYSQLFTHRIDCIPEFQNVTKYQIQALGVQATG